MKKEPWPKAQDLSDEKVMEAILQVLMTHKLDRDKVYAYVFLNDKTAHFMSLEKSYIKPNSPDVVLDGKLLVITEVMNIDFETFGHQGVVKIYFMKEF